MYSPDGFASLACAVTNECFFLGYQQPFIELMHLLNGNYFLFFLIQALVWFALIGSVYFLAKTLKVKHLFLAPFLLLFAGSLFVDNYVGSFENDYMAIVLFVVAMIFWYRKKHYLDKWISLTLICLGTSIWMWLAYFKLPVFWHSIAEMNWWVQILAWNLLAIPFLITVWLSIKAIYKKEDKHHFGKMCLLAFCFPKLWFFAIPALLMFLDQVLSKLDFKPNYKFWMSIIIFSLILGQVIRVGALTYSSWSYTQDSNCYTVNHEYLARVQGKSLYYNQATIYEYEECLQQERESNAR